MYSSTAEVCFVKSEGEEGYAVLCDRAKLHSRRSGEYMFAAVVVVLPLGSLWDALPHGITHCLVRTVC